MQPVPDFSCRSCNATHGSLVLDLGLHPPANRLLHPDHLHLPEPRHPLRLAVCHACWLVQLLDILPPDSLFSEYPYFSSVSDTLVQHAARAAARHVSAARLGPDSFVVEIASNDGYLLRHFKEAGVPCLGIEPAANIARVAIEQGIDTRVDFFSLDIARRIVTDRGPADLVLANNVFAHVPTPNDFVSGLATLTAPGGRIVLEFPELLPLLDRVEFDTIYHEHVFYFSLTALDPLLARHGLEVFDIESLPIHGGSFRLHAAHAGRHPVHPRVAAQRRLEHGRGIASPGAYANFSFKVHQLRSDLLAILHRLQCEGRRLAAYGASAKGSTLLNFCGIGRNGIDCLEFVADRSPAKQGFLTPGSHLPILPARALLERRPDFALLLTWNFADEILRQQSAWCRQGGRFILPLPKVGIVAPPL